ncbi:MAG: hypothetical protein KDA75_14235 [Planctomycetaceae bacterium]|nr:hypothetical protein [Planctomycetaceae bacterium]
MSPMRRLHQLTLIAIAVSAPSLFADDAAPTPIQSPANAQPSVGQPDVPADLPAQAAPQANPPADAVAPAMGAEPGPMMAPQPAGVPGVTTFYPPVPMVAGNGWMGGYSPAYAPTYYYWYHVPAYTYAPLYVPGYTSGIGPASWNGYWNYSTAYAAPGYTAYWHGWNAGPNYGYAYGPGCYGGGPTPAWGSYSNYYTVGWGHGHWHLPRVFSPHYHCGLRSWW